MSYFDEEKYKRRLEIILTNEIYTKALRKLPKNERSIFIMAIIRNDTLEHSCKVLNLSKKEALQLEDNAIKHFLNNVKKLSSTNEGGGLNE
jgi:DNA-directed RNA polymerase specialized sigma subunit